MEQGIYTYKILKEIGSGGGGTVYLAEHLRLGKQVVLKADKRRLTVREELLRREVDVLKNLKNPYIPQVYDYFQKDDTVYTVMEYIEGESLDKPLKRGETFSQAQVIRWMAQLLNALEYLHAPIHGSPPRGYVHSDIKPANLMKKPDGDLCLIDFNIALALGEEHAVGYTPGYASPEHYGLDFSSGSGKKIVPDVRSDLYSTGATFYHLLSGRKPARDATEVKPLSRKEYSEPLVRLLEKAMNPNPDLRYQSAEEMLDALLHLREKDLRTVRFRRQRVIIPAVFAVTAAVGAVSGYVGLRRMQLKESILKNVEYARTAQEDGDTQKALEYIGQAFPEEKGLFSIAALPQAQEVLTEILGVYDLADGIEEAGVIELPSQPLDLRLSPDSSTAVFLCNNCFAVADLETLRITATLDAEPSVLAEAEYVDDHTIAYAGAGGLMVYDLVRQEECWSGDMVTSIAVSGDGSVIAALYKDAGQAELYDAATGEKLETVDFGGAVPNIDTNRLFIRASDNLFELNDDGSLLAVSFEDGSLSLYRTVKHPQAEDGRIEVLSADSGYEHFEGGFYQNYFAFTATRKDKESSAFVVIDTETKEQKAGIESAGYYFTTVDVNGILLGKGNILEQVDPETGDVAAMVDTTQTIGQYCWNGTYTLISSGGNVFCFNQDTIELGSLEKSVSCDFLAAGEERAVLASEDAASAWVLNYKGYSETDVLQYDADYAHHKAQLNQDGSRIVLAAYNQFRIYDRDGNMICDTELPDADRIYDVRVIRQESQSYLEITYMDGLVRNYDLEDGQLLMEETEEVPDLTLDDLFPTESYNVEADLREKPRVYERGTGELVAELEEDAYLEEFFETDQYLVARYRTASDETYGCLMDKSCQTLAYIPYLCDVLDNTLYLDCPSGQIRSVKIYELQELQDMLQNKEKGE